MRTMFKFEWRVVKHPELWQLCFPWWGELNLGKVTTTSGWAPGRERTIFHGQQVCNNTLGASRRSTGSWRIKFILVRNALWAQCTKKRVASWAQNRALLLHQWEFNFLLTLQSWRKVRQAGVLGQCSVCSSLKKTLAGGIEVNARHLHVSCI